MNELEVTHEFIEENKNICQLKPKTSPHTKIQRKCRRDEVYKLHFEYGYSARHISKILKKQSLLLLFKALYINII